METFLSKIMRDKYKILTADVPPGIQTLRNILDDSVGFREVVSIEEAKEFLGEKIDLIVCGIHFDESRMFDFLRTVKADAMSRDIPLLCFRDLDSELAPTLIQSLEIACRALGAVGFVDLYDLKSKCGIERADERFREVIFDILKSGKI
jgi:hypothetical protein